MREEEEKNKPDQQRKHGFFVHEDITAASAVSRYAEVLLPDY